jgi:hypothetical protein
MTTIIDEKGMGEITIGSKSTILHGTFENVALFEKQCDGIFALIHRMKTNTTTITDLVNIIWCFSYDRDTEGWSKDDIMRALFSASKDDIDNTLIGFIATLFTPPHVDETDTKKKTVRRKS